MSSPGAFPPLVTGAELLAFASITNPTAADSEWADLAAGAVSDAIWMELDLPPEVSPSVPVTEWPEIVAIARLAGGELVRRRDAPYGTTGYIEPNMGGIIRFARDYITSVWPVIARYRSVRGLVA